MAPRSSNRGGLDDATVSFDDRFIVDNEQPDSRVAHFLCDWCESADRLDIATGYFGIGGFRRLDGAWLGVGRIRVLMGADLPPRSAGQLQQFLNGLRQGFGAELADARRHDPLAVALPGMAEAMAQGRVQFRVYRRDKFHAKAYIATFKGRPGAALVGSSNFTGPGIGDNVELNVHIADRRAVELQSWFDRHWELAEDVTPVLQQILQPAAVLPPPFLIYLKSLQALFETRQMPPDAWETIGPGQGGSRLFGRLDGYQQDGYRALIKIANTYNGAFLCDGVGLGKTFIGMMVIERLIALERKKVVLLVPKSARDAVWERTLEQHLPHLAIGELGDLAVFNHTDLQAKAVDTRKRLEAAFRNADAVVIDEAHAFRNPGIYLKSRYWRLKELAKGKQLFLLTATPVNNRLWDLKHLIDLFAPTDYHFAGTLGVASLMGHFRTLERALERTVLGREQGNPEGLETDSNEAERALKEDRLVSSLVVQRSRSFVRRNQRLNGGKTIQFPHRDNPKAAPYSLADTFGKLLDKFEKAFSKPEPLLSLALYMPNAYARDEQLRSDYWTEGRQRQVVSLIRIQLLKRLESSIAAFDVSCRRLFLRLLSFVQRHAAVTDTQRDAEQWVRINNQAVQYADDVGRGEQEDGEDDVLHDMLEDTELLSAAKYDVTAMVKKTYADLDQMAEFLLELKRLSPFGAAHDDKIKSLTRLLQKDAALKNRKVLIFSEFKDTARYVAAQLIQAGVAGVAQIDSDTKEDRAALITRFSPYYNGSSSSELATDGKEEIRVLVSTDVLAEGLNLQDATRLINYDLHWNPVRLMQRIGRVDRRLDEKIEAQIVTDHPDRASDRGRICYWNFLPPHELNRLIKLYERLTGKVLRISMVFGIEGGRLLTDKDQFEALRDFNAMIDRSGNDSTSDLQQLYQDFIQRFPDLEQQARQLPDGSLSGRAHPVPGNREVFLCYALPGPEQRRPGRNVEWSEAAGQVEWVLYDPAGGKLFEPAKINARVQCEPQTPYVAPTRGDQLLAIRDAIERELAARLKLRGAPADAQPKLVTWMALE